MKSALKKLQPFAITLSISAMVVVAGCGDDGTGLGRRYTVAGKVTYKGEPVAHGTVNFLPTKPPPPAGRAATGQIKDGYYSMSTSGNEDGALPGEYNVAIVAMDIDMSSAASSQAEGGRIHEGDAKYRAAVKNAKQLIPIKYTTGESSGLKATIEGNTKSLDFDLKD
jgi:hypothetical protein